MGRGALHVGGAVYDLRHLDPFLMSVTPKAVGAPELRVLVSFGSHTFTREVRAGDPPAHLYVEGGDERCFCPVRYGHSALLPDIVRNASNGRVFFSQRRHMLCVEWLDGLRAPYAVFFNLERSPQKGVDATMFVVSAYEKPGLPDRLPAVTFATLVSQVVAGRKPVIPTDLRSIKK